MANPSEFYATVYARRVASVDGLCRQPFEAQATSFDQPQFEAMTTSGVWSADKAGKAIRLGLRQKPASETGVEGFLF